MAFIRDRSEERTGYQASSPYYDKIDLQCDFVMVYNANDTMPARVRQYRENGYIVHLMTGIAWGDYAEYLSGRWDGRDHTDESQTDRAGNPILHGPGSPYMVPTVSFADYITERLKKAVDAGVEAIHVEEPEFWDRAGYSAAFQREYRLFYREPWQPPHASVDARYKTARLKAFLYARAIERVSAALKEYALTRYGRELRFYVPTHSLLNYIQWKIVSPEGKLADIPSVDGFIAQVWTGTAREKNWFDGVYAERTFETSYLEYGVMQELAKGTGRTMWFLHDPIEDNPAFDWNDYRANYFKTVTASLLHPKVNRYEICPWPNRVFDGKYPAGDPDAQPIPPDYATVLNSVFQTLGDMERGETSAPCRVGVLLSDTALYQRGYPDGLLGGEQTVATGTVLKESEENIRACRNLFAGPGEPDGKRMPEFLGSNAFPAFFGLCMPLLKYGLPVRPVLLDNVRRYNGYLDDYDALILSYEYMKPEFPDINNALAAWVRRGGRLLYAGDGSDPYHRVKFWWNGAYETPAHHLFDMLGIAPVGGREVFEVGAGAAAVWRTNPARFCMGKEAAAEYREFVRRFLRDGGYGWEYANYLLEKRGPYIVAAVMDESDDGRPLELNGLFADMYSPEYDIIEHKTLQPGENALLRDMAVAEDETLRVIGTSVRVMEAAAEGGQICLKVRGPAGVPAHVRLLTPFPVKAEGSCLPGGAVTVVCHERSRTALLSFESAAAQQKILLKRQGDETWPTRNT